MKAKRPDPDATLEPCADCGRETRHSVRVEIRTENPASSNAAFSREPYRVAVCGVCESESIQRMNDA
jgi:formate dehydrogenase assembly factor FdhD